MKTTLATLTPRLTLETFLRPLALLVLALGFSGCASTGGLQSRRPEPVRPAAVADDWDHQSTQKGECTIALIRWSF